MCETAPVPSLAYAYTQVLAHLSSRSLAMPLPPRDHRITLDAAAGLTRRYRESSAKGAEHAGAFHADQVRELLAQKGCVAMRVYYGKNEEGRGELVLVGIDENDKEMTGGILLDVLFPCPPFCEDGSALNR